jgi:phosphoribosylanthranilate isomerase
MIAVVKIGPMTSPSMVSAAIGHGADMIGFAFDPGEKAALGPDKAATLVAAVPSGTDRVAHFTDASDEATEAVLRIAAFDMLQLDGRETPNRLREIRKKFGLPLVKTLQAADFANSGAYEPVVDWLALDAGGDYQRCRSFRSKRPWLLRATLAADDIAAVTEASGATALDLVLGGAGNAVATMRQLLAAARPLA